MPDWLVGLLIVVVVTGLSIAGVEVVRRKVDHDLLKSHQEVAGFIYAVVGVIYAVLLAFVIIVVWEKFDQAAKGAEQEANQLADLSRDANAFSDSLDIPLERAVARYADLVVSEEWPRMAQGGFGEQAHMAYDTLWRIARGIRPTSAYENAWYGQLLDHLNKLGDYRRLRLLSARTTIPSMIWVLLIAGGAITISFTFLFDTPHRLSQWAMVGALSGLIAFILFLISSLDQPFDGSISVQPHAFESVVDRIDRTVR